MVARCEDTGMVNVPPLSSAQLLSAELSTSQSALETFSRHRRPLISGRLGARPGDNQRKLRKTEKLEINVVIMTQETEFLFLHEAGQII